MNRKVLLMTGAAVVVIVGAWYALLWSPARSSMASAHKQQAAAEALEAETLAKVRALQATQKNLPAIQARVDVLRKAVPASPELDGVISTVNDAANQAGVELQGLAPAPVPAAQPTASPNALSEIPVTISANGSYFQLVDFVHRLSTTPRLLMIDNFTLTGEKDGKQSTGISGRMFVQPKPAASTPAPAPAGGKS